VSDLIKPLTVREKATLFDVPPTKYNYLSLGAGVQSSCLALMADRGEFGPIDGAIFADTQSEPASVYEWLDYLQSKLSYPVYRVTKGSLEKDELRIRTSGKTGKRYLKGSIPAFVDNGGSIGILGRKCTADYKIIPIQQKVRELVGIKRGGKGIVYATMMVGISWDEIHRMKKSRVDYIQNRWPLLERRMTRQHCLDWIKDNRYPQPPRSACTFCPFHSDGEWTRLQKEEPAEFERAVQFEKQMQEAQRNQEVLRGVPYLHSSCQPLDTVDFAKETGQQDMFHAECEGMCGL